jgi:hypothetical protein
MLCVCDDFILFLSKTSIMSRYVTPAEFLFVFGGSSHMSTRFVVQGGHLPIQASEMVDSSSLIATGSKAGIQSLRNRLNDDGYALLRGFLPRATVLSARAFLLHSLVADGFIAPINTELDVSSSARQSTKRRKVTSVDWTAGITATALNENASPGYLSRRDLHCAEPIMKVLEHDRLFALFDRFFDEPCQTTQFIFCLFRTRCPIQPLNVHFLFPDSSGFEQCLQISSPVCISTAFIWAVVRSECLPRGFHWVT